ncbi:MAG TPA: TlyA family RNA methyltransferase [Hyphomicrobiaceae bacterium]|nr:TlyA family RNA methyltransferase [Hyphomicrobiaceae bacterium]
MPETDNSIRLDLALVRRGLAASRSQARDLIVRGSVTVDNVQVLKPGMMVGDWTAIGIAAGAAGWVSRGAVKLLAALDKFEFEVDGRTALDIGASTGGFTQVLLKRGAARVYAVDVGRGQLHPTIADDPRVVQREATDARSLTAVVVTEPVRAIVADVSFISLTKALPAALALAAPGCWLIGLVKPQFEAGPAAIGKGGIVRDAADRARALRMVRDWLAAQPGWRIVGDMASPITGGSGNEEFLVGAVRDA